MAIALESFRKTDFDTLISWIHTEKELIQFAGPQFAFPLTLAQLDDYIQDSNRQVYKAIDAEDHTSIGHAEIYKASPGCVKLCRLLIGDATHRGKGIGRMLVNELLRISFLELDALRVELNVYDWNAGAIRCYENAGLTITTGKTKTQRVNDEDWISINMAITRIDWQNRNAFQI